MLSIIILHQVIIIIRTFIKCVVHFDVTTSVLIV